ncbi:MAG: GLUG motif-containing protein [Candidatus Faecousia sp.]|nr:GLUG motif-containing protein [Candidatus Faecousia sp.]
MKRKLFAAVMALLLLTGLCPNAFAAELEETEPEVLRIGSAEDFLAFAENCALDSWSQGAQVQLLADISLEGTDFAPIPTFGGSFDGGGHTISGLSLTQSLSPAGLFGTLQPTAVVKNLTVQGTVTPGGDGLSVGGIVGENHGMVEDCAFTGTVAGEINTGGIAGMNYGTLRACRAEGSVTGDNRTGGIAGYNFGRIASCRSDASVNTESVDPTINPKNLRLNFNLDFSQTANLDAADAASDTGGIAGYSSGTITDCVNTGPVGYPHIGYNLGGIAGRSCGFVEGCRNEGFITGRKDVGGVVGQIEPHIQTILSPDYLETLSKQFENLGGLVSRAGSNGADMGGDVQSCIQTLTGYQSSARSALESLVSGAASGEVNEEALSSLGSAVQGMANTSGDLRNAIGQGVDTLTNDISAISGQISAISRTFALATEDAKKETVTDISEVDLDAITEGLVGSCQNSAAVEGDLNVGGITGVMGLESTADPEDDAPSGNLTQRRRYELKAIVRDCENTGRITGKRSYVGGICGRMELGLICESRGFGTITSENGDYVGGIAGLTGGTIRGCFAKCTLSGGSYIGGIVGSGIAEDFSGDSSTVTGCYSMVEIPEYEQYAGAIAGVNTGVFTGNYFVSDTLAGINRVSYSGLAEPMPYDALHREEALPDPLKTFTLSFVADGQTLKTVPFHYGDSFDASVFPELPQREGCYAQWSAADLTDLRFDTVVEAAYYPYITALYATQTRADGKPVLFVQGQFQDGDSLVTAPGTTPFPETENQPLLEQWHISIPADGLESHTIRYLPAQEDTAVYLLRNGSWSAIAAEAMGSYLAFEAAGAEVEIAVTAAPTFRMRWMIPAAAALLLLVILGIVLKKRGKRGVSPKNGRKKYRWILVPLLLAGAAAVSLLVRFPQTRAGQTMQAYDVLKAYLEQPEQQMNLTVKAQIEDRDAGFTARISRVPAGDTQVTAISEGERRLYYAGGVVFLEDGTAFRLNKAAPDYSALLETVLEVCRQADISAVDGVYTVTARDSQATDILKLLMPSAQALLPKANRLTVDLITENGALSQLRFTGAGNLTDSVKTPFSLSAVVEMLPASGDVTIPQSVVQAVASGNFQARELYSDDLVRLIDVWTQIRSQNPVIAQVTLEADCGELTVSDDFTFYQWKASGAAVLGVEKDGKIRYFTDNAACDENGRKLSASGAEGPELAKLLDIALGNIENTEFQCRQEEGASVYTFALNQAGMEQLVGAVFPKAEDMAVSFEEGSIRLRIADDSLQSVEIACGGSGKLLTSAVDVRLSLKARLQNDRPGPALPDAVKQALLK